VTSARLFDSVPVRLGGFAVVLVATFVLAFGVGNAVGSPDTTDAPATTGPTTAQDAGHDGGHGGGPPDETGEGEQP
jgi:hypothetical protein